MKSAQSAMEFTIMIAALLFIFLPIFYLLGDFSLESSTDLITTHISQNGQKIIDEARELYYLGPYAKEIITIRIPDNIIEMSTVIYNDTAGNNEYVLNIMYQDKDYIVELPLYSEIPIVTQGCNQESCDASGCMYRCLFNPDDHLPGIRNFRLETAQWKDLLVVNITQVQW